MASRRTAVCCEAQSELLTRAVVVFGKQLGLLVKKERMLLSSPINTCILFIMSQNILSMYNKIQIKVLCNGVSDVMDTVLASSSVDRGFAPRSGETKTKTCICVDSPLSTQH